MPVKSAVTQEILNTNLPKDGIIIPFDTKIAAQVWASAIEGGKEYIQSYGANRDNDAFCLKTPDGYAFTTAVFSGYIPSKEEMVYFVIVGCAKIPGKSTVAQPTQLTDSQLKAEAKKILQELGLWRF